MSSIEPAQATDRKPGPLERTADFQSNIEQIGNYVIDNPYYGGHAAGVLNDEKENAQRRRYDKQQAAPMGKSGRQSAA